MLSPGRGKGQPQGLSQAQGGHEQRNVPPPSAIRGPPQLSGIGASPQDNDNAHKRSASAFGEMGFTPGKAKKECHIM